VSLKIRFFALCALSGACACLHAAEITAAPLAIYYSFDTAPPRTMFTAMQSELTRILAPARLQVAWRSVDNRPPVAEAFREIVVLRFRGACQFEKDPVDVASGPDPAGLPLAETELVDGHILPFGEVRCDQLRRFIAPVVGNVKRDRANAALGRAVARVGAHELYHMLTGSMLHASRGIARAEHSRAELVAVSFTFARPEQEWLRLWAYSVGSDASRPKKPSGRVVALRNEPPAASVAASSFVNADSR
jgi:hypothetical protein